MANPLPGGTPAMGEVDPDVIKAAEAEHTDGYAHLMCKTHGVHVIPMDDADWYAENFIERADFIDENTCPLDLTS